jgi:GNAT superfamily N-acetyltransferase
MALQIRRATPDDAPQIQRFIEGLAEYEHELSSVEATPEILRRQLASDPRPFECLIAEVGEQPVGFALYYHTYSTWKARPGIYVEDLFVLPEFRRRGIGEALLRRVARVAVEEGCGRLEWAVLDWNRPAILFYESLGARAMSEWTVYRLSDAALAELGRAGET